MTFNNENEEDNNDLKETWILEQSSFASLKLLKTDPESFYRVLSKKLFIEDIEKIKGIEELWKGRQAPNPLSEDEFNLKDQFDSETANDHEIWELKDWISLFKSSILNLLTRPDSEIIFDKDDLDTLNFVASAANIRAKIFGIKLECKFEIKAMAGNIIPAIATTNAIAAGMIVVHAANILSNDTDSCCNAYINYGSIGPRSVFTIEKPCKPNPNCTTCSCDRAILKINCDTFSIKKLISSLLPLYFNELKAKYPQNELVFDEEDLMVLEGNRLIYDFEDENRNGSKPFSSLNITDSKFIKIDLSPNRPLLLGIIHSEAKGDSDFEIDFDLIEPKISSAKPPLDTNEDDSEDEPVFIVEKDDSVEIIEKTVKKARIESQ